MKIKRSSTHCSRWRQLKEVGKGNVVCFEKSFHQAQDPKDPYLVLAICNTYKQNIMHGRRNVWDDYHYYTGVANLKTGVLSILKNDRRVKTINIEGVIIDD